MSRGIPLHGRALKVVFASSSVPDVNSVNTCGSLVLSRYTDITPRIVFGPPQAVELMKHVLRI